MTSAQQPSPSHQIKNDFVFSLTSAVLPAYRILGRKHRLFFPLGEDNCLGTEGGSLPKGWKLSVVSCVGSRTAAAAEGWHKPV